MSDAPRAVAVGGGTGLPKVLWCLLRAGYATTAVVTMADDGGSSGHLRRELGMLPPGDARNCLLAMADSDTPLARVFAYRFPHGDGLAGHALGNLIIAALADIEGSFPSALETAGSLLGVSGRVLPSTLDDVVLTAEGVSGARVVGQVNVAESAEPISRVRFAGGTPAQAYAPAADAIRHADLVVVGPGSLFTSILPNFLVQGVAEALRASLGRVVYVCNVANQRGETSGMDAAEHVDALLRHGLHDVFDVVLAHDSVRHPISSDVEPVLCGPEQVDAIRRAGPDVVLADLADPADPRHHERGRLLRALGEVTRT